jgi:Zn finger protein HypA/HybF involved in hydrogenase expression
VVMKCDDCGASFNVDLKQTAALACPECGGEKYKMVSGREYYITNMEAI